MWKSALPVLMLLGAVIASIALDRPAPPADFTFINRGDVTSLDLQRLSWMQDLRVARLLFEGLARKDVFTPDYDTVPAAAESWEIDESGRVYTFHVRPDARWSNGEPLRASDFIYSWRRAMIPDSAADYTGLFMLIQGAQEFYDFRQEALSQYAARPHNERSQAAADEVWRQTLEKFDEVAGVEALDDRTLRVTLNEPTPYFLDLCAFPVFYPVYPPLVQQYESVDADSGALQTQLGWTKPPRLISNGPYVLTTWRFKRDMRLEANPRYHSPEMLAVSSIAIPSIEEANAQVLAFGSGSADWVSDVAAGYRGDMIIQKRRFYEEHRDEYERLKAMGLDQFEIDRRLPDDPRAHIHAVPAFGTYWYNFNCLPRLLDGRVNPFADPRIRRAFAMAIEKQTLVDEVMRIGNPVATTIIPPGSIGGYTSPKGVPFDPEGARTLLAQAGYPDPSKFPIEVEILFNKDGGHDLTAQYVAKQWEQNLGVPVRLAQQEIKVYKDRMSNGDFIVTRAGWYGDYGDPTTFLDLNRTGDGNNDRKYSNSTYDDLLVRARTEKDPEKRMALLGDAERIIMDEDLPMIPLYHYVSLYLFNAHHLSGINAHPRLEQNLYLADILGDGKGPDVSRYTQWPVQTAAGGEN